jgi:sugar O-acyltransferase (sialic acid O-acetyltransferase NeuD family)
MMQDLILVGAGGHAMSCIDVVERTGLYRIVGLIGLPNEVGTQALGYDVLGTDAQLPQCLSRAGALLVAVGQIKSPGPRISIFEHAQKLGFSLPVIIAQDAIVSRHASLGAGSIVMHGAVVNAGARIGRNAIINSKALIEHGAEIGDHCHVSTGAIVNGNVSIGDRSFVGSGSVLREGMRVGRDCLIGMGLSVRRHLPDNTRYIGDPV